MTGPYDAVDPNEYPQPPGPRISIRGSADLADSLGPTALMLRVLLVAEIALDLALVPALFNQRSVVLGVPDGTASLSDVRSADRLVTTLSNTSVVVVF